MNIANLPGRIRSSWQIVLIALIGVVLVVVISVYLPDGVDWHTAFRPAARQLAMLKNPYEIEGFFNAPWTLLPLIPLALLPESAGRALLFVISVVAFGFAAYHLGARPLALGAFTLSPPVIHCLLNANIDWMPLLGFVLPPQIGLFFVVTKPQVGFALALFWLVEAWREGGLRQVVHVFWPVSVCSVASVLLFGPWPLRFQREVSLGWNASLWPMSIPVGLALLVASIRTRKANYAMAASPCLSPYVLLHAWSGALVSIVSLQAETLVAVAGLWILVAIRVLAE